MKYFFSFLVLLSFIFTPISASTTQSRIKNYKGWFNIEIKKNKINFVNKTKKCYLIIDEENKVVRFGSIYDDQYHLTIKFVKLLDQDE